jgi:hypothetical protein
LIDRSCLLKPFARPGQDEDERNDKSCGSMKNWRRRV